ncbi:MAG: hypothetical protein JKY48_20600 [Flavobacteriales bacterium]|nr:hypothetical protein [Flavobacteriales bacterium]
MSQFNFSALIFLLFFTYSRDLLSLESKISQQAYLKNFTTNNGLADNTVYQSIIDDEGVIWFATDRGISSYDGRVFKNFNTSNGLQGNTVFGFHKDGKGRIWYYTLEARIGYYENKHWHSISANKELGEKYGGMVIGSMHVNEDNSILIGFKDKFFSGLINVLPNGKIEVLKPTDRTNVGIYKPFDDKEVWTLGIGIPYKNIIGSYTPEFDLNIKGVSNSIYLNSNGRSFWSINKKLYFIDSVGVGKEIFKGNTPVNDCFYDSTNGNIYVGTQSNGLYVLNNNKDNYHLLPGETVYHTTKDSEGGFWISTKGKGVFYWHPTAPFFFRTPDIIEVNEEGGIVNLSKTSFLLARSNHLIHYELFDKTLSFDTLISRDRILNYKVVDSFLLITNGRSIEVFNSLNFDKLNEIENVSFYDVDSDKGSLYFSTFGLNIVDTEQFLLNKLGPVTERLFAIKVIKDRIYLGSGKGILFLRILWSKKSIVKKRL